MILIFYNKDDKIKFNFLYKAGVHLREIEKKTKLLGNCIQNILPEQNYHHGGEKYHCSLIGSAKETMCIKIRGNSVLHSVVLSSSDSICTT